MKSTMSIKKYKYEAELPKFKAWNTYKEIVLFFFGKNN